MSVIEHFAKVDDVLWRGARPDADGMAWLLTQGCKTIINLEWEESDPPGLGMVDMRLADWEPLPAIAPRIEDHHIRSFLGVVRGGVAPPIFVHCHSGQNRTGVAVASYRLIIKSDPLDVVLADMKSFGGLWADADINYVTSLAARAADFGPSNGGCS
jgi:tyrosine-protein phosphatase SIW14